MPCKRSSQLSYTPIECSACFQPLLKRTAKIGASLLPTKPWPNIAPSLKIPPKTTLRWSFSVLDAADGEAIRMTRILSTDHVVFIGEEPVTMIDFHSEKKTRCKRPTLHHSTCH